MFIKLGYSKSHACAGFSQWGLFWGLSTHSDMIELDFTDPSDFSINPIVSTKNRQKRLARYVATCLYIPVLHFWEAELADWTALDTWIPGFFSGILSCPRGLDSLNAPLTVAACFSRKLWALEASTHVASVQCQRAKVAMSQYFWAQRVLYPLCTCWNKIVCIKHCLQRRSLAVEAVSVSGAISSHCSLCLWAEKRGVSVSLVIVAGVTGTRYKGFCWGKALISGVSSVLLEKDGVSTCSSDLELTEPLVSWDSLPIRPITSTSQPSAGIQAVKSFNSPKAYELLYLPCPCLENCILQKVLCSLLAQV